MSKAKKRAAEYGRFSSDMQREESIDAQYRAIREFAAKEDFEIVASYADEAVTGTTDNRDDFQRMIADAKKGGFDYILVHKFNRFARNKFDSVFYKKRLKDMGVKVISVTQTVDDTPEGQLLESLLESMDQYFSENLSLEAKKGLKENALAGRNTGGMPPLGYEYDEFGNYVINEEKAHIIRLIFNLYTSGYGMTVIANMLNERGYVGRRGKDFSSRTVAKIIQNERYTGEYIYTLDGKEYRTPEHHDPIIDKAQFEKAQEIRTGRNSKPRSHTPNHYYLTGRIQCACCGGRYAGGGRKGRVMVSNGREQYNAYYVCSNKRQKKCSNSNVNKDKLEHYLARHIYDNILNDDAIETILLRFQAAIDEYKANIPTAPLDALKNELRKLESQKDKFLDLYADDEMDKATLKAKLDKINKRRDAVAKEIKTLSIDSDNLLQVEDARELLYGYKQGFNMEDKTFMRALLQTFVDNVVVHKDKIEIEYKIDFNTGIDIDSIEEKELKNRDESSSVRGGDNSTFSFPEFTLAPSMQRGCISKTDLKRYQPNFQNSQI